MTAATTRAQAQPGDYVRLRLHGIDPERAGLDDRDPADRAELLRMEKLRPIGRRDFLVLATGPIWVRLFYWPDMRAVRLRTRVFNLALVEAPRWSPARTLKLLRRKHRVWRRLGLVDRAGFPARDYNRAVRLLQDRAS